jgi:hypothetical protein
MDEELTNLKKYLYELCQKIGGIQILKAKREDFFKEYRLYFLLFVHRISDYYKGEGEGKTLEEGDEIHLIKEINKLYTKKLTDKEPDDVIDARKLLVDKKKIIDTRSQLKNEVKDATSKKKQNEKEQQNKKEKEKKLTDFETTNADELKKIEDAHKTINEYTKSSKEIDNIIDRLLSLILGDKTPNKLSDTQLNNILYKTTNPETDNRLKINIEIDKVRKIIDGSALSVYYSYINKIIHKINPKSESTDVKGYVEGFFNDDDDTKKHFGITKDEDLRIRKAFLIYLINNIIYYYIILKHDIGTDKPNCDAKIRYIFDNRYIKFSKIAMTAPTVSYTHLTLPTSP